MDRYTYLYGTNDVQASERAMKRVWERENENEECQDWVSKRTWTGEHYRSTKCDVMSSDRVIKTVAGGALEDYSTQVLNNEKKKKR